MDVSTGLKTEAYRYQMVRRRLLASWPETDAETLADTLEGITDLHEMIAAVIRSALVDEALQAGLRTRLEDMRKRLSRLEERGAKKRQLALGAMCEVGLKKLEQPGLHRLHAGWAALADRGLGRPDSGSLLGASATQARSTGASRRLEARQGSRRRPARQL